ncbi:MAG: SDR family NAD(P)-dependent oxidoreductase [Armatimonadota bacterium]
MQEIVTFTDEAMRCFEVASRDTNPLHRDDAYARTTQFGRRVVYGMLGALAALGRIPVPPRHHIRQWTVEFAAPLFVGVAYRLEVKPLGTDRWSAVISEGSRALLKATARIADGAPDSAAPRSSTFHLRRDPADRTAADIEALEPITGRYTVDPAAFAALQGALAIAPEAVSPALCTAMLWSSWLVGMEVPGKQALFNGATFELTGNLAVADGFDFVATVKGVDPRFGLIRTSAELATSEGPLARCEVRSFVRKESDPATDPELPALLGPGEPLAGKVALVIGASRGLGALIARGLALQGAVVHGNYHRSADHFARLRDGLGTLGHRLIDAPGDGSDPNWCRATVEHIVAEHGRLDLLVCNACPTILPMAYEAASATAVHAYIADAVALASHPLAASLDALALAEGRAVVISSAYAEKAPANFPHYVAAKCAIEGLVRSAAGHHTKVGFVLVRPPRLEGELNIPFAGETSLPAAHAAAAILAATAEPMRPGDARLVRISPEGGWE